MEKPTPDRRIFSQLQENPWPLNYYEGPGGGASKINWIKFTLNANTAANATGSATITESSNPSSYPVSATVTVSNETGAYGYSGAEGQALLIGGTWIAFIISTPSQFILATATSHSHSWSGSLGSPSSSMPSAVATLTISSPTMLSEWPSSNNLLTTPIANPYNYYWRSGAQLLLMHSTVSGGRLEVVGVIDKPLEVKFKLTADVPTGSVDPTCSATAIIPLAQGPMPTTITVKDRHYLMHNGKANDKGVAVFNLADNTWECIACEHMATRLKGTLGLGDGTFAFTGAPENISVSSGNYTGLNGYNPTGTLTVKNRFNWDKAWSGSDIYFEWDNVAGEYFGIQIDEASCGQLEYFWPPPGGIPAAVSTSTTLRTGVALCYRAIKISDGNYQKDSGTALVENEVAYAVGASGKPMGCIPNRYGRYTVVVEDCSSGTPTGIIVTPPAAADPIVANSTKSTSESFRLGV